MIEDEEEFDLDGFLNNDEPERPLLYVFQQEALPEAVFSNHPELMKELDNEVKSALPLLHFRAKAEVLCERHGYMEEIEDDDLYDEQCEDQDLLFEAVEKHSFKENGYTLTIFSMPEPEFPTESYFIGMLFRDDELHQFMQLSPSSKYFTLEKKHQGGDSAFFCEINSDQARKNLGELSEIQLETFKKAIFKTIS